VAALRLPLLAINIAIGLLLVRLFEREAGLRPRMALLASLFFILAAPKTSATFVEPSGGNVEPLLYVILLWMLRRRPVWFGLVLAVGFLQREFTAYGALAVVLVSLARGEWRDGRDAVRRALLALGTAAAAWAFVQVLRPLASAAGPGTSIADLSVPPNNLLSMFYRFCFDLQTIPGGLTRLATQHWRRLFGTYPSVLMDSVGLESRAVEGAPGLGWLLAVAAIFAVVRLAMTARRSPSPRQSGFAPFLLITGVVSAFVFVISRCGFVETTRYDLLSVLGACGLAGCFFIWERSPWMRRAAAAVVLAWAAVSATGHAQIWWEYSQHPPLSAKVQIIDALEARGIKYATADYWLAYYISFITNERIIASSTEVVRIDAYQHLVNQHKDQAVWISRRPCPSGPSEFVGAYLCRPE
jgi:hypothetical protein